MAKILLAWTNFAGLKQLQYRELDNSKIFEAHELFLS